MNILRFLKWLAIAAFCVWVAGFWARIALVAWRIGWAEATWLVRGH